jgi:hypothetical protein
VDRAVSARPSRRLSAAPSRNWTAQYSYGKLIQPEALEPGDEERQTASVEYNHPLAEGNWATSVIWGRKHKELTGTNLNSYLAESTVNFKRKNYAYTRLELVDKDELFPDAFVHPAYRIGAYTFGGVRDLVESHDWQLGLGADVTFYSKPSALDATDGTNPVSFRIFLRPPEFERAPAPKRESGQDKCPQGRRDYCQFRH